MELQPFQTQLHQRVRLRKDGQDEVYPLAHAGAPGWVRKHKRDSHGYPLIFIEWDKDHWSYNLEPDRWVMEAHFEPDEGDVPVEQPKMPDTPEEFANMMGAFFQFMQQQQGNETTEGPAESEVNPEASLKEDYAAAVKDVGELLDQGEAYIVITVRRDPPENGVPVLTPRIASFYQTTEAGLVCEMQLSRLLAMSHEEAMRGRLREALAPDEGAGQ